MSNHVEAIRRGSARDFHAYRHDMSRLPRPLASTSIKTPLREECFISMKPIRMIRGYIRGDVIRKSKLQL
jgi:hypothetical protein